MCIYNKIENGNISIEKTEENQKQFKSKLTYLHTWLAHLVSRFACNTRVIDDASSNPPVSNDKSL